MATDPLCGMTVDVRTAAGSVVHVGQTYYFCSPRCQHEFEANPAQYAVSEKSLNDGSHDGHVALDLYARK
jgi:Cu+-exporting ATPase